MINKWAKKQKGRRRDVLFGKNEILNTSGDVGIGP